MRTHGGSLGDWQRGPRWDARRCCFLGRLGASPRVLELPSAWPTPGPCFLKTHTQLRFGWTGRPWCQFQPGGCAPSWAQSPGLTPFPPRLTPRTETSLQVEKHTQNTSKAGRLRCWWGCFVLTPHTPGLMQVHTHTLEKVSGNAFTHSCCFSDLPLYSIHTRYAASTR